MHSKRILFKCQLPSLLNLVQKIAISLIELHAQC
jgi:hypothetical protein